MEKLSGGGTWEYSGLSPVRVCEVAKGNPAAYGEAYSYGWEGKGRTSRKRRALPTASTALVTASTPMAVMME